jgi:hypothetical protein
LRRTSRRRGGRRGTRDPLRRSYVFAAVHVGRCKSFARVSAHRPTAAASYKRILLRMTWRLHQRSGTCEPGVFLARCHRDFWRVRGLGRRNPDRARQVSSDNFRLRELSYARGSSRQARLETQSRRLRGGIRDSRRRRFRRRQPDPRQGNGPRRLDDRADYRRHHQRRDAERPQAVPSYALAGPRHLSSDDAQAIAAYLKSLPRQCHGKGGAFQFGR